MSFEFPNVQQSHENKPGADTLETISGEKISKSEEIKNTPFKDEAPIKKERTVDDILDQASIDLCKTLGYSENEMDSFLFGKKFEDWGPVYLRIKRDCERLRWDSIQASNVAFSFKKEQERYQKEIEEANKTTYRVAHLFKPRERAALLDKNQLNIASCNNAQHLNDALSHQLRLQRCKLEEVKEKRKFSWNDFEYVQKNRDDLKIGDSVLRVCNGLYLGKTKEVPSFGDKVKMVYATPNTKNIANILHLNDRHVAQVHSYEDSEYDLFQHVILVRLIKWHIPEKDPSYNEATDNQEIVIDEGEVTASMSSSEFQLWFKDFVE